MIGSRELSGKKLGLPYVQMGGCVSVLKEVAGGRMSRTHGDAVGVAGSGGGGSELGGLLVDRLFLIERSTTARRRGARCRLGRLAGNRQNNRKASDCAAQRSLVKWSAQVSAR